MQPSETIDFTVTGGDAVSDEVREAVVELVTAGLDQPECFQAILIATANLIGNNAASTADVEETVGAIRRLALRVQVGLAGGGEA